MTTSDMAIKKSTSKIALITGANAGMGYETALALASRQWRIIMTDKDDQTVSQKKIIEKSCNENIQAKHLDLSSFKSIRDLVKDFTKEEQHLDVLINNAGVFCMKNKKSCDGLDAVMQINHLGPFLLTNLLIDLLKRSEDGRIIFVASSGAFFHNMETLIEPQPCSRNMMSTAMHYYNSKLCTMVASKGFAENLKGTNVTSNCCHPGMTNTSFLVKITEDDNWFEKIAKQVTSVGLKYTTNDVKKSIDQTVFLASSQFVRGVSGQYFVDYRQHVQPKVLHDAEFCKRIWSESEILTRLKCYNK